MRTQIITSLLAAWTSVAAAAPAKRGEGFINSSNGGHQSGGKEYVVLFNSSEPTPPEVATVLKRIELSPDHQDVKATFSNAGFTGFVANMKDHCIDALNAMDDVGYVEEAVTIKTHLTQRTQYPWGPQRVSSASKVVGNPADRAFTYSFDDPKLGAGVDIYIVDTGIRTTHAVFGGRAQQGFSFFQNATDGDGHGTHVAGTSGGDFFGLASGANLIAVKVLGNDGSGPSSAILGGLDFVIKRHNQRKTEPGFVGSIMSMSWGTPGITAGVDQAILSAVGQGIHASVAAGNEARDACLASPAHLGGANSDVISVGAVDINDRIASFSNTGSCVDVYAPGVQILSSVNSADNHIDFLSGTSMACPHTTGVMAYLMAQDAAKFGQNPKALKAEVKRLARSGVISGNTLAGDPKTLLSNGVDGSVRRVRNRYVVVDSDGVKEEGWEVRGTPEEARLRF